MATRPGKRAPRKTAAGSVLSVGAAGDGETESAAVPSPPRVRTLWFVPPQGVLGAMWARSSCGMVQPNLYRSTWVHAPEFDWLRRRA